MYRVLFIVKGKFFCFADENCKPYEFKTEDEAFLFVETYEFYKFGLKMVVIYEKRDDAHLKGGDK